MYRANKNIDDINYILDNLRTEDLNELKSSHGDNYKDFILKSIENKDIILTKTKKIIFPS